MAFSGSVRWWIISLWLKWNAEKQRNTNLLSWSVVCCASCFILKVSFESLSVSVFPPFLLRNDFHLCLVVSPAIDCSHLCCSALLFKKSLSHFLGVWSFASLWFTWFLVYRYCFCFISVVSLFVQVCQSVSILNPFSVQVPHFCFCLFSSRLRSPSVIYNILSKLIFPFQHPELSAFGLCPQRPSDTWASELKTEQQLLRLGVKWRSCSAVYKPQNHLSAHFLHVNAVYYSDPQVRAHTHTHTAV